MGSVAMHKTTSLAVGWLATLMAAACTDAAHSLGSSLTNATSSGTGGVAVTDAGVTGMEAGADAGTDGRLGPEVVEMPTDGLRFLDGGIPPDSGCAGMSMATEAKPVVLQMVVDASASMLHPAPNSTGTKWDITRNALVSALGALPESVWIGVQFFPNQVTYASLVQQPHTACINQADNVNVAPLGPPGSTQRLAIDRAFARVTPVVAAGTPTLDAYVLALEPMVGFTTLPTDQFVLLITDGQPTFAEWCLGTGMPTATSPTLEELTDPIVAAIGNAYALGIKTFVIGSPGSEVGADGNTDVRPWLSQAARAGGTAPSNCVDTGPSFCHFDMTQSLDFASDLGSTLRQITSTVVPCIYDVPLPDGGTIDPYLVSIFYTSSDQQRFMVVPNQSPTCDRGWHYTDATMTKIEICGATCDRLHGDPGAQIDVVFGCEPIIVVE
jgi:hypothetical protein